MTTGYGDIPYGGGPYGGGGVSTVLAPTPEPPSTEPEYALGLDMYNFLIAEIREQDKREGFEFVKRYLHGPQRVWDDIVLAIEALPQMWSVTRCSDAHLQFLKNIVGWTKELQLRKITDTIDDRTLRRLISVSGALWRGRGPEDEILNVLNVLTGGARARIWNWFDFRWVLDETELGEEHQGRDPWIISLPVQVVSVVLIDEGEDATSSDGITIVLTGVDTFNADVELGYRFRLTSGTYSGQSALVKTRDSDTTITLQGTGIAGGAFTASDWEVVDEEWQPDDAYRSNLRIMDTDLDRTLVKRVLRLMRGCGERFDINYLLLLDRFNVEDDDLQWQPPWDENLTVEDGVLKLTDDTVEETTVAIVPGAPSWSQYVAGGRFRGHSNNGGDEFGMTFYQTGTDNYYSVVIDSTVPELFLYKTVGGVKIPIASVDLSVADVTLLPDVYYLYRVAVAVEAAQNRIQVFIDGAEMISVLDAAHSQGAVGFRHDADASMEIDEIEVFALPADTDTLEINEYP